MREKLAPAFLERELSKCVILPLHSPEVSGDHADISESMSMHWLLCPEQQTELR